MADLFRKSALDTMATPEQLDRQVKIMRPSTWILYAGMVIALATFIVWSFSYRISNGVNMQGIVFTNNNIISNVSIRECMITDVLVSEGEYVKIGDILAVVSNDEMLEKITDSRYELSQKKEGTEEYEALRDQIDQLVESYVASMVIKSNGSGHIQTVKSSGTALQAGDYIATVMSDSGYNEVIAYVPLQTANNLSLGMSAQVSPTYAPREEYGYMTGVVTAIADTPVSEESILAKMGTLSYVESILPQESCVEVRIRLDLDETSANGYKWSNSKGAGLPVELGTQCSIVVITRDYLPVELLTR